MLREIGATEEVALIVFLVMMVPFISVIMQVMRISHTRKQDISNRPVKVEIWSWCAFMFLVDRT